MQIVAASSVDHPEALTVFWRFVVVGQISELHFKITLNAIRRYDAHLNFTTHLLLLGLVKGQVAFY